MIAWTVDGKEYMIETETSLFSPENIDKGTLAMLQTAEIDEEDKLLDLGCGYGTVGIYAALVKQVHRITMVDINEKAVECARKNVDAIMGEKSKEISIFLSDGLKAVPDRDYTVIMSNPPYHADFSVPKRFIEEGYKHLITGGRMVMVTKRRPWYENKLRTVFGGVKVIEKDGYYIFISEKREHRETNINKKKKQEAVNKGMSKKLARKVERRKGNRASNE